MKPERFTLTTMRKRIDEVGDLTKGMWRYKRSLIPLFAKLDLEPADPTQARERRRRGSSASAGRATAVAASPAAQPSGAYAAPRSESTVGSPRRRGGLTSRHVQSFGSLSGRKRRNRVPCRKRLRSSLS